ncbi:MAG: hypothetical protein ACR2PO_06900 [Methyloligellaceae bacterium]
MISKISNVSDLTEFGRVQLSPNFFMRDMLYSEVANFHGLPNVPEDPELAVEAGRNLAEKILEPLHQAFGAVTIRSAYRSPTVNGFCNEKFQQGERAYFCSDNAFNRARHIWDQRDAAGFLGATASILIPWYLPRFRDTGDPRPLAWWIRDHVPDYDAATFYPWLCAFNIRWYEGESPQTISLSDGETPEVLTEKGMPNFDGDHSDAYPGFPKV